MALENSDANNRTPGDRIEVWRAARLRKFEAQLHQLRQDLRTNPEKPASRELMLDLLAGAVCANREGQAKQLWSELFPHAKWGAPFGVSPAAELREWCEQNGASHRIIEPSCEVSIPTSYSGTVIRYRTQPVEFATFAEAKWIPGWDFIIASDGTVISDSSALPLSHTAGVQPHAHALDPETAVYHRPADERYIDDDVIFLSAPIGGHFGHWLLDHLPRLLAWDYCGSAPKVAVPSSLGRKHIETLRGFGLRDSDILVCERGSTYRFKRLHFYKPGSHLTPNLKHPIFVREILSRHADAPTTGKRIYLSRTSVNTRMVANSDEFKSLLSETGFISIDLADYSIAEQQKLLAEAEVLMGAYGSNMLALYMAPPSCRIICLADDIVDELLTVLNYWLPAAAFAFGQHFCTVHCRTAAESGHQRHKKDADIVVDCGALRRHAFLSA